MYKLAETFIKKESQWQAAAAPLGWTGAALGAGLGATAFGVSQFLKNPSNVKTLTDIPGNTWNGIKNFSNNIGNYVAPKKSTINSAPKPINWTNSASADNTSVKPQTWVPGATLPDPYVRPKPIVKTNTGNEQIITPKQEQATQPEPSSGNTPNGDNSQNNKPDKDPSKWGKFKNFANNHKWSFKYPFGAGIGALGLGGMYGGSRMIYDFANSDRTKTLDKIMKVKFDEGENFNKDLRKQNIIDSLKKQNESLKKQNESLNDSIKKFNTPKF